MARISKRVSQIQSSLTLDITQKAKRLAKEGIDVVGFGAGEPDFDTPEYIKLAAIQSIKEGFTKYTPSSGIEELRTAISKKFLNDNKLSYQPSQIVVSCGAKHSLYNIFQTIIDLKDEVIIPSPYWLSYPEMVTAAEGKSVFVKTAKNNSYKLTEKDLSMAITKKTKALILNSPSNPTGAVYSIDELRMIARIAVRHGFFVISDEIYERLVYDGKKHVSIGSLDKEIYGLTLTVNGVSKSYSMTGWRIGYAAGPNDVMQAISNLQSHATSNPSSISQKAALAAITGDRSFVEKMRLEFEKRRNLMVSKINKMKGISCIKPEGAFYVFCDISAIGIDSITLASRLLDEARVAVVPGKPFGDDRSMRLSFATSIDKIEIGLGRIKEWLVKNG